MTASDDIDPNDLALLSAYVDGELDAKASADFERRIDGSPELAAEAARLDALGRAIGAATAAPPPVGLLARINARLDEESAPRRRRDGGGPPKLVPLAAALAAGYFLAIAAPPFNNGFNASLAADHQRALLAAQPVDIAASNFHMVKPWLSGRLGVSPRVPDLSKKGFALVGGRVSVVAGVPSPTIVYRAGGHLVSVFAIGRAGAPKFALLHPADIAGFHVTSWREGDIAYWAVSDASPQKLAEFAAAFRKG